MSLTREQREQLERYVKVMAGKGSATHAVAAALETIDECAGLLAELAQRHDHMMSPEELSWVEAQPDALPIKRIRALVAALPRKEPKP